MDVRDFTETTGPIFPDVFNVEDESAKAYCDLMFSPNMIRTTVRQTNNYARWKMPTRTIDFVFNLIDRQILHHSLVSRYGVSVY